MKKIKIVTIGVYGFDEAGFLILYVRQKSIHSVISEVGEVSAVRLTHSPIASGYRHDLQNLESDISTEKILPQHKLFETNRQQQIKQPKPRNANGLNLERRSLKPTTPNVLMRLTHKVCLTHWHRTRKLWLSFV